jgi:hypothetical protein
LLLEFNTCSADSSSHFMMRRTLALLSLSSSTGETILTEAPLLVVAYRGLDGSLLLKGLNDMIRSDTR